MTIKPVGATPLYTKQQIKSEVKMAAISAAFSGGLTLALNKGHGIKRAGIVAGTAAGISVLIGLIQRLRDRYIKTKAENDLSSNKTEVQEKSALDKTQSHQG